MARRGNQLGPIGSSGASNPKTRHQRRMMRRHRLLLMMDKMTTHFWSPRINTQVTWATESVTTSPSLQPLAWRWEWYYCWTLRLSFVLIMFTHISFHLLTVEEILWHTTGACISCGSMERWPGCTSELHRPRGLHVLHMGLDRPIQGTETDIKGK